MDTLIIDRLLSGGVITNYYCSSRCRHCLYGSSPSWEKHYLTEEMASNVFQRVMELGCRVVHLGGGEPLLDPPALEKVLDAADKAKIIIEYVETNSSWYRDEASSVKLLKQLKNAGLETLLLSMSPFHNEYVPFYKVKGVVNASRRVGLDVFPWIGEFFPEIDAFDDKATHPPDEYCQRYGKDYLKKLPLRYWVNLRGRALITYQGIFNPVPMIDIVNRNMGCKELVDTTHFHFDLFGNYIPGLCSGLVIKSEDLGAPIDPARYPLLNAIYTDGVKGLLQIGQDYGFIPEEKYISKCHLCHEIRMFLVKEKQADFIELGPAGFYEHV